MKDIFGNKKLIIALSAVCINYNSWAGNSVPPVLGQTKSINTITSAVPFLMIAPDARAGGMGDAGVASSPDANSIHWNPAKLAFVDKQFGMSVSYTPWLRKLVPDINLAYLSAYYKVGKNQTVAGSLRYFSLGDITFTNNQGDVTGQFRPNEFALDLAYATKLGGKFSGGMDLRYIYSNLTLGQSVDNAATHAGQSVAVDVSGYYHNDEIKLKDKKAVFAAGINISNVGSKMAYSNKSQRDFIPINLRIGPSFTIKLDDYNTLAIMADVNKLLIPTPPIYATDPVSGTQIIGPDGKPTIAAGADPNRGVASGIFGSFNDAPGGFKEEMRELNYSLGTEWWYDKQFALRFGYFYEDMTKGNRQFFTLGAGLKYNVFGLDFAYLIPTQQRNPLENTLRFTLLFDFAAMKQNLEVPQ